MILPANYKYDLAIVSMFRNEGRFLKEWIEFHKLVGVQHFFLYNNSSTDNYKEILTPYINKGIVELKDWNIFDGFHQQDQEEAFRDALKHMIGIVKWAAFLDLDEFLYPVYENNLLTFLKDYEDYGGICVNWLFFGTSDIECIPNNGLMIEHLTMCNPNYGSNIHIKSIVRPDRTTSMPSAHYCEYKPPYFNVNADKFQYHGAMFPYAAHDKIRINHYWTRDIKNLLEVKIPNCLLARAWENQYARKFELMQWLIKESNELNKTTDTVIHKYLDRLKSNLKKSV